MNEMLWLGSIDLVLKPPFVIWVKLTFKVTFVSGFVV